MSMGFLQRFFHTVVRDTAPERNTGSFEAVTDAQLERHLEVDRYGDFFLTGAIRPSFDLRVVPSAGYRRDRYRDEAGTTDVPVIMASVSRELLLDVFFDLLDPLGESVDVVLETSHHSQGRGHEDLFREHMDLPILKSLLYDYEDLLLNDGCTGLAVLNPHVPLEVQFDEHKLLVCYGEDLSLFENVLRSYGVRCRPEMKFITEAEHVHSSREDYYGEFMELRTQLGMDSESDDSDWFAY
jgi:hypothetical protein